jgi:hypothetical protein
MTTPRYDALIEKVRDWSNKKEEATIPDTVIEDCLKYSADDCYRKLRVPPLEATVEYLVNLVNSDPNTTYTRVEIPPDLTEFVYIRVKPENTNEYTPVFHQVTDSRTFLDRASEKYNSYYWMWQGNNIFIHPQVDIGATLELHYYKRLADLDALYAVSSSNYLLGLTDADQPYLVVTTDTSETPLYFVGAGVDRQVFDSLTEANDYALTVALPVVTAYYTGKEVDHWLRDENERLLMWGALYHAGAYLIDEAMESRYEKKFVENVNELNREEKMRRAKGGNVQTHFNTGGMI